MGPIFLTRPNPTHKWSDPTQPTGIHIAGAGCWSTIWNS